MKEDTLDRTVCRNGFGRGCGPVVRHTEECMDERTNCTEFYVRGSVRRNSRLKKFNEMQQYADIYLLLNLFAVRLKKFNEMQQYADIYLQLG